jgi:hypothetical protein
VAHFIFLSGPECGTDDVTMFGLAFHTGYPVEVTDPMHVGKLRGNRFFLEVEVGEVSDPPEVKRPRGRPRKVSADDN